VFIFRLSAREVRRRKAAEAADTSSAMQANAATENHSKLGWKIEHFA